MSSNNIYYVYQYIRKNQTPYYIGKGSKRRAWATHRRKNGCDLRPRNPQRIQIIQENLTENEAWELEIHLIAHYGRIIDGGILVNTTFGGNGGATVSSESRTGVNNPMFNKPNPCSSEKRMTIIRTKNLKNYYLYKEVITKMNNGQSYSSISLEYGISRNVCYLLYSRKHCFFEVSPELK